MHHLRTALLPIWILPVLSPALLAQGEIDETRHESYELGLTPPQPGGYYTRTAAGDFDGDLQLDMAYRLGNTLEVMLAPGLYEARMTQVATAKDFVTLPGSSRDDLLVVSAAGLSQLTWNESIQTWDRAPVGGGGWSAVQELRIFTTSAGASYVVGLESDRRSFRWLRPDGGGIWIEGVPFTLGAPVDDFLLLQYDSAGLPELAVVCSGTLAFYRPDDPAAGPLGIHSYPSFQDDRLARVGDASSPRDWVAWIATWSGDGVSQTLAVVGQEGLVDVDSLGAAGVAAWTSGDYDLDGSDDLLVGRTADYDLVLLTNQGDAVAPSFSLTGTKPAGELLADVEVFDTGVPGAALSNRA